METATIPSLIETPLPIKKIAGHLPLEENRLMRKVRAYFAHPSAIEGSRPELMAAYCFDILSLLLPTEAEAEIMDQLQRYKGVSRPCLQCRTPEVIQEHLRLALRESWCAETAVPRARDQWSRRKITKGQSVVTALFIHECFDGHILWLPSENGPHYWNELPAGGELDLTREEWTEGRPGVASQIIVPEVLLKREEAKEIFALFQKRMIRALLICGIAAMSLRGEPPDLP